MLEKSQKPKNKKLKYKPKVKSNASLEFSRKKIFMWLFIVFIMIIIFTLWAFALKHQFSLQKPNFFSPVESETSELKNIQQEFSQTFSELKEFKFGEILKNMKKVDEKKKQPESIDEKEIEELRENLFN